MVHNTQLTYLINRDPVLKFKHRDCFARDTFPILKHNEFVIINTDPSSRCRSWSDGGGGWATLCIKIGSSSRHVLT